VSSHITRDKLLFQSAWTSEVRPRLDQLILDLQFTAGEDNPRWREIQSRGLTGEQLKLKRARLAAASLKRIPKKILDIINSILGSIPGAEPINEFKELVEDGLDDPNFLHRGKPQLKFESLPLVPAGSWRNSGRRANKRRYLSGNLFDHSASFAQPSVSSPK
jgi:hypothetical protein